MTSASITPATPRTPSRRRKPDPARVVQSYQYIVERDKTKRGAYRKTAEIYNISDETVRRWVHEHEASAQQEADELLYTPTPVGYP